MQIIPNRHGWHPLTSMGAAFGLPRETRETWQHLVVPSRKPRAEGATHISLILLVLAKSGSSHLDFNWPECLLKAVGICLGLGFCTSWKRSSGLNPPVLSYIRCSDEVSRSPHRAVQSQGQGLKAEQALWLTGNNIFPPTWPWLERGKKTEPFLKTGTTSKKFRWRHLWACQHH